VGTLYGRERECAQLGQLVASAADGAGGVVIVEGGAGIGKSRLLTQAARIAAGQGVQVASGGSDELDQVTPWAPLLGALFSTSPTLLSEADLAPLRTRTDQRLAVIECIRGALEEASRRRPLLITLDDLQWADPATLLALASLPVQLFSYPVAWILAWRPQPASPQLQTMSERLAETGATRLHLPPLDAEAAAALATETLGAHPDAPVMELIQQAAGNPLYVVELLRGIGGAAAPPSPPGTAHPPPAIPASLRAAVAAHLRPLPDPAQDLLKVASVLGREFTVSELAAMTGRPAGQLLPAIAPTLQAEVLAEVDDRLVFRHDVLRQTVYQDIPVSLRQALHRDAAAALRGAGASLARVAGHYAASAERGDEEAVEALTAAAAQLFTTAPGAAADLAVRALGLLPDGDPRTAAATSMAVGLLGWAGRLDETRALGEGHLASHPSSPEVTAGILLGIRRAWVVGRLRAYPVPLPPSVLDDPAVPAGVRANLLAFEQLGPMWAGRFEDADQCLVTAMRLVAEGGEEGDAAGVLPFWVLSAALRGDLSAALERAVAGIQPATDRSKATFSVHQSNIVESLAGLGRPHEALAALTPAVEAADASGLLGVTNRCRYLRAALLFDLGKLEDARAEARGAALMAGDFGFFESQARALAVLAETSLRQGDLAEAESAADRLGSQGDADSLLPEPYWIRSLCADARGRPRACLDALEPVFAQLRRGLLIFAAWHADRLPRAVGMALRAGADDYAALAAAAAVELTVRSPDVPALTGIAAHAAGLLDRDVDLLRQAAEVLAGCEWPLATAAAWEDLGNALAEHGSREQAVDELDQAYQAYIEAGAHRDTARVRAVLRSLGVRKRHAAVARPGHGWASLTKAELAVVEIVAEGRTNREAAAQLYVSADTVNTHLRHAFAKLGIRSRVELARLVLTRPQQASSPTPAG
jgi:DNA-binding CsgD family transcriptional regulator